MSSLIGRPFGPSTPARGMAAIFCLALANPALADGPAHGGSPWAAGGNSWISSGNGQAGGGNSWIGSSSGGSSFGGGGAIVIGGGGFGGAGAAGSGPNQITYNPPIIVGYGPYGPIFYAPPIVVVGQGGTAPIAAGPAAPTQINPAGGGMRLPMPAPQPLATRTSSTRRANHAKAREYVEFGDRSFRGDNTKRAEDRYRLAAKADPGAATPRIRLAQVALVRGRYAEAARFLREAVAAEPGYLLNAPDIQAIYPEPGDFAKELANLEAHLQAEPGDRDAWFVLGAEWYLSGRTQKASDAFQRLTDRRPDLALAAFLDASSPRAAAPDAK